jgi:tRNA dimethylallyltransferase
MQTLVVIEGPTASGKTALSIELAKYLNTVVISADSRQFYKEVSIGTAKPSLEEMQNIPHYFVDSHNLVDPVSASRFADEAMELIQSKLSHLNTLVLVGGSGMFIDALCIGLDPIPVNESIQQQLRTELNEHGLDGLLAELKISDPEFYSAVDKANTVRILRALEVIRSTGKTFSSFRKLSPPPRPFHVIRFVLDWPRDLLYERINLRVDQMVTSGLEAEVRKVNHLRHLASLQTVGYREFFDYFDEKSSLETTIEKIKQHTRNYAKRQLTWFKRHPDAIWINPVEKPNLLEIILQHLQSR